MKMQYLMTLGASCLLAVSSSASTINAVGVDANQNVTSITIDGTLRAVDDLIRVSDVTAFASVSSTALLGRDGAILPAVGDRAKVIDGDDNLETGFANLASASTAVGLLFEAPIVNGVGADLVLFEMGGGELFKIKGDDGVFRTFTTTGFVATTTVGLELIKADAPVTNLAELESATLTSSSSINQDIHAILVDLSDHGYADGVSITTLNLGGANTDLMAVYGLGAIPEPASIALLSLGGLLIVSGRRR